MTTETITQTFSNPFTQSFGVTEFLEVIAAFRAKARTTGLSATEHIIYNKLRNLPLDRGFTKVTNTVKLANGVHEMAGYNLAYYYAINMLRKENEHLKQTFKLTASMQEALKLK